MNKIFPLNEQLWKEWLTDEQTLATSEKKYESVLSLFQTALKEFMCKKKKQKICKPHHQNLFFTIQPTCFHLVPSIWIDYCNFVQKIYLPPNPSDLPSTDNLKKIRSVYEEAVSTIGMNFASGHTVWALYRSFESEILNRMETNKATPNDL